MDAPRLEQIRRLRNSSIKIIDRQQAGGLTLTVEKERLMIRGFLDQSLFTLKRE
jgi:hypothetical protein